MLAGSGAHLSIGALALSFKLPVKRLVSKLRRPSLLFLAYAIVRLRCSVGGTALALSCCLFWFLAIAFGVLRLWEKFTAFPRSKGDSFRSYLWYRFVIWFGKSTSQLVVLTILVEYLCLASAITYAVVNHTSVGHGLWQAWYWIVNPNGGAGEALAPARMVGAATSLGGVVIFALLVSLITETFSAKMDELKACESPIVETGHTVLLGWADSSLELVRELAIAAESEGGTCVAVLDRRPGGEIREEIYGRLRQLDLKGSSVVVRHGEDFLANSLRKVAAASAKSIIIQQDPTVPELQSDAVAMQKVLALRGQGWPECGHIVVQVAEKANEQLFKNLAPDKIRVVVLESTVADTMVLSARYPGLGKVLQQTFGFEGDEFYVESWPGLSGKTFQDVVFSFADAVVVGVVTAQGHRFFKPSPDHIIQPDEKIVVYAEDDDSYHPAETRIIDFPMWLQRNSLQCSAESPLHDQSTQPDEVVHAEAGPQDSDRHQTATGSRCSHGANPQFLPGEGSRRPSMQTTSKQRSLVLGWNGNAAHLLNKIAAFSRCVVLSENPVGARLEDLAKFKNHSDMAQFCAADVEHVLGCPAAHFDLKAMNVIDYDNIFILADAASWESGAAWERSARLAADGSTVASILIINEILAQPGNAERKPPCIVPQILEASTADILDEMCVSDYIDSTLLVSSLLAAVSEGPAVQSVIQGLTSSSACSFHIRPLQYYLPPSASVPARLSFWDVVCFVRRCSNDICAGWSRPHAGGKSIEWVLNPRDKHEKVTWSTGDQLVIIGL